MSTAAIIAGTAASIGGAAIASHGATSAAKTQAAAADAAAQLQSQDANRAMDIQQQQYNQSQQNIAPWLNVGRSGLANLASLMGILPPDGSATSTAGITSTLSDNGLNNGQIDNGRLIDNGTRQTSAIPLSKLMSLRGGGDFNPQSTLDSGSGTISANGTTAATPGGGVSLASLVNPNLGGVGSLLQDWTGKFVAPTNITEQNDPGYQARLDQGQKLLEHSAAARGDLLSSGTAQDLMKFGQDYASNEYGNVYNRAFNDYSTAYNTFKQNQADKYNRLASLAGVGQTAASTLNAAGANLANNSSTILMNSGQQIGNDLQNAGAARATGYQNSGNIWGNTISNLGNNISMLALMGANKGGGGGGPAAPTGGWDQYYGYGG